MRIKKDKILGISIPGKPVSREELAKLTEDDLRAMGIETRFWDWYLGNCWFIFKVVTFLMSAVTVFHLSTAYISGNEYDYVGDVEMYFKLLLLGFVIPIVVVVVATIWWYGEILVNKIRGRSR